MLFAILGYSLIALPFVVLFVFCLKTVGWQGTLFAFGLTALVVAIIAAGAYFLSLAGIVQAG